MPNTPDYIPRSDSHAIVWFRNLRDKIAAEPIRYALSPADANQIAMVVNEYEECQQIASMPSLRTKPAIAARQDARATAEHLCRGYAQDIRHNDGVSDESKIGLGLRPKNLSRKRIPVPSSSPALTIVAATPGNHTLAYRDSLNKSRRAKPRGARALTLVVGIADAVIRDPAQCTYFTGWFTRTPLSISFSAAKNGMQASYYGRWSGGNCEFGPWSTVATMAVCS